MRYDKFQELTYKKGKTPCVVISTGEEGVILDVHRREDCILVKITRPRHIGERECWFNYMAVATW